jgi:hypothetical protein
MSHREFNLKVLSLPQGSALGLLTLSLLLKEGLPPG